MVLPAWSGEDLPSEADDDALAFFVFGSDGRLIFSDGRRPDDLSPLAVSGLPAEVEPLAQSLNDVLARLEKLLKRERAFVSDAAHELRSPLTALKVQAEVAQLAQDEPQLQAEALAKLLLGIDRTARLVEQLLALSRLAEARPRLTAPWIGKF